MKSNILLRALNAMPFTWLILALPAYPLIVEVIANERYYAEIMYESGEISAKLFVLALALTPLQHLFKDWPKARSIIRWLIKRRRAIGVASFSYAAFHTYFYVRKTGTLESILLELEDVDLALGWLAFAIMLVLAATSNQASVRRLGVLWKPLQRAAYLGAALTALHWYWVGQFLPELIVLTSVTLVLQLIRYAMTRRGWRNPPKLMRP